ncbi:MAG: hypothetical protein RBG13Loki_1189 [Promethearchaeota archaeon CR_4]|nr:MAG: hypothetical protein RBG13Loki_1189 [Candidatus Lokiarchaeota archaeon CR_4]
MATRITVDDRAKNFIKASETEFKDPVVVIYEYVYRS